MTRMFETLKEHTTPAQGGSDRSFGIVFAVFFAIIGLIPAFYGRSPVWSLLTISIFFLLVAMVAPRLLAPLNRLWTRFGILLHKVVSPLILAIIYFALFTPIGLLMRVFGKDSIARKVDPNSSTYWLKRHPPDPTSDSLHKQF